MQLLGPTSVGRRYVLGIAGIVGVTLFVGCKSDPPAIPDCAATSGEAGCEDPTGGPPPTPSCADPDFEGAHPPATEYTCEGQAGGAIVYNQVILEIAGEDRGGPDFIEPDPPVTDFPASADVSSCCYGLDPAQQQADEEAVFDACAKDCGRAACNRVLDDLRSAVMSADPSRGGCDPLGGGSVGDACRDRVRVSLQAWISSIEENYDDCVSKAVANSDPSLPYTDPEAPFVAERKLELADPGCSKNALGCLYDAELRPFCDVQAFSQAQSCEQAGNPIDDAASTGGGADGSTSGGGVVDPWGDLSLLVDCTRTSCLVEQELFSNVGTNFGVIYDDGVDLQFGTWGRDVTGLKVTGLDLGEDSRDLFDAFGIVNGDVITHVNGVSLDSAGDIWSVVEGLQEVSYWEVTVRRYKCLSSCSWSTLNYDISVAVTVSPPDDPDDLRPGENPSPTSGASRGGVSEGTASGCGCRQSSAPLGIDGLIFMALVGLLRRPPGRRSSEARSVRG